MNLKELARHRGTNLKQVAEKCGIPASTLYAISRGDTNLDNVGIDTFLKLSGALGMDAQELMNEMNGVSNSARPPARQEEDGLPPDERSLLNLYRKMDTQYKAMMLKNAEAYVAASEKEADADGVQRTA